jgi:hypothetical protein
MADAMSVKVHRSAMAQKRDFEPVPALLYALSERRAQGLPPEAIIIDRFCSSA